MEGYKISYRAAPGELSDTDLKDIHDLHYMTFGYDFFTMEELKRGCHWWVIEHDGWRVGFSGLQVFSARKTGFVFLTGVTKPHRNQGLKKRLVRAMEAKARKLGLTRMVSYADYWNLASANSLIGMGYKLYEPDNPKWGLKWSYFFRKEL